MHYIYAYIHQIPDIPSQLTIDIVIPFKIPDIQRSQDSPTGYGPWGLSENKVPPKPNGPNAENHQFPFLG